jgi:sterol desaturase/sphingolipid hydroxylase (fatty acid hydroxylase superfamily)
MSVETHKAVQGESAGAHPAASRLVSRTLMPGWMFAGVGAAYALIEAGADPAMVALGISVLTLIIVAVMERVLPYYKDWNKSFGDVHADVASMVIVAGGVENVINILAPVIAAGVYAWLQQSPMHATVFPSHWPLLLQAILLVLLADLAKYWFHRFSHEHPLGWRLHSVHHAVKRVYWLNGFRIHPLYHVINFALAILPWLCLGVDPRAVALYSVILAISAAFQHANIDLDNGWFNFIFNTNELHRWHHSRRLSESNANYGAVLVAWDLLFGTYRARTPGHPQETGMVIEDGYPLHSYYRQLAIPFATRYWRQKERAFFQQT